MKMLDLTSVCNKYIYICIYIYIYIYIYLYICYWTYIYNIGLSLEINSISAGVSLLYPYCKRGLFVYPAKGLFPFTEYTVIRSCIFGIKQVIDLLFKKCQLGSCLQTNNLFENVYIKWCHDVVYYVVYDVVYGVVIDNSTVNGVVMM